MEVVQIGTTDSSGFPVYQDRLCHDADGVLAVNRVKPHTGFTERVESGICKMLVIGMGKQAGASKNPPPGAGASGMGRLVLEGDPHHRGLSPARGWLAPSRSWRTRSRRRPSVQGVPVGSFDALIEAESALLRTCLLASASAPLRGARRTHRGRNRQERERFRAWTRTSSGRRTGMTRPRIGAIYVRGLTEGTHGNAVGLGNADIMPRSLLPHVDLNSTYMNAFTAKRLSICKVPMLVENELQALQVLLNFRAEENPASLRLAWIRNTSLLDEMWGVGRRCSTNRVPTPTSTCCPSPLRSASTTSSGSPRPDLALVSPRAVPEPGILTKSRSGGGCECSRIRLSNSRQARNRSPNGPDQAPGRFGIGSKSLAWSRHPRGASGNCWTSPPWP